MTFLLDYGFERESIKFYDNHYGRVVRIIDFIQSFELILEPKGIYYRIDLRINYPYHTKKAIYEFLKAQENELNNLIGFEINFGRQMKRLKLDLQVFENYEYDNWDIDEFKLLKPILSNVIKIYKKYINNAVQQCV